MITKTASTRITNRFKEHIDTLGSVLKPHAEGMVILVEDLWLYIDELESQVVTQQKEIKDLSDLIDPHL